MNWLKPMLLMVVLGAILYGVYVVLNKGPAPEPPPGVATAPPNIQLGIVDDPAQGPSATPPSQFGPAAGGSAAPAPSSLPATSLGAAASINTPPAAAAAPQNPFAPTGLAPAAAAPAAPSSASLTGPSTTGPASTSPTPSAPANPAAAPAAADAAGASPASRNMDVVALARANGMDAAPAASTSAAPQPNESFGTAFMAIKLQLADGKLAEALRAMTKWYDNPKLTADESRELSDLIGQVAGTVVYSRQHLLEQAYIVRPGDRLDAIATQYNVPVELLAKINGVGDPNRLTPGSELKVIRGPFEARVNLERREMTLIVEGCYAGRFTLIGVGDLARTDLMQKPDGVFTVAGKRPVVSSNSSAAAPVPGAGPLHHWVDLSTGPSASNPSSPGGVGIVGTDDPVSVHPHGLNLSARDAEDVYDILSIGSRVVVRK